MKKLLITTLSLAVTAVSVLAQGEVSFASVVITPTGRLVDAPVRDEGGALVVGTAYMAQLWGRAAGSASPYAAIGAGVTFLPAAANLPGHWLPSTRQVPGVAAGSQAQLIARAWRVSDGTTWDAARANNRGWGESQPVNVTLTGAPATPAPMVGLQGFSLVPEPSTIALGILGGLGTLFLMRRRKN
jgi:hypothetical protein